MRGSFSNIAMMMALVAACSIAAGCAGDDNSGAGGAGGTGSGGGTVGCEMNPTVTCPTPPVTYSMVKSVFDARCANICHNGMTPDPDKPGETLWAMMDYKHVSDWRSTIREQTANCTMPPPDAGVPITIEERKAILEFIRCGLLE